MRVTPAADSAAALNAASIAVALGRTTPAWRTISSSTRPSGTPVMVIARAQCQLPSWKRKASLPMRARSRRQPQPSPLSHNSRVGTGSQAQAGDRPGTLIWNTA